MMTIHGTDIRSGLRIGQLWRGGRTFPRRRQNLFIEFA